MGMVVAGPDYWWLPDLLIIQQSQEWLSEALKSYMHTLLQSIITKRFC